MKKREKENVDFAKNSKKNKKILGLGIFAIILLIVGVSYAWWSSNATQQSVNKIASDCLSITLEDVDNSAINLEKTYPITDAEASFLNPYTFKITNVCNNSAEYSVQLEIMNLGENQLSSQYLSMNFNEEGKKRLTDYQSVEPTYKESDYTANEARLLTTGMLNPKESVTYSLKIWIDESVTAEDPTMNKEFIGKVSVISSMAQLVNNKMSDYIIHKSKIDNTIEEFTHEATAQTSALTDYRYTGSDPNNYVYFGCSDNCTEDNLYRIIGVIPTQSSENGEYENRVKLIKANYYMESESGLLLKTNASYPAYGGYGYLWNNNHTNKWEESTLQTQVLNGVYWNSLGEYQNYIEPAKWYLGAPAEGKINTRTIDEYYNEERSNVPGKSGGVVSYINNIGLMYLSDYGYAAGSGKRDGILGNLENNYAKEGWVHKKENQYQEWTIVPESSHWNAGVANGGGVLAHNININGGISNQYISLEDYYAFSIRPTFYLKSNVLYKSGDGSINNPYQLSAEKQTMSDYIIAKSENESSIEKITHDATIQTLALTDYRYTGSNPNNYVYFGCSDTCTEDNLYRIIGVIPTQSSENGEYENRVKLIKANYYTETNSGLLLASNGTYPTPGGYGYQWNNNANNKWEESTLQQNVLNGVYWNSLGEYQSYIEQAKWYLGAPNVSNYATYTPDQFYAVERSNTIGSSGGATFMTANISLMYPSDYAYSIGSGYRTKSIENDKEQYISNAWLYNLERKYYEWTMASESSATSAQAWTLDHTGELDSHSGMISASSVWGIRPTFYLKSNVLYKSGAGSINNPYRVGL